MTTFNEKYTNFQDFNNLSDMGMIMSSVKWLIDHYKAKEKYRLQMVEDLDLKPGYRVLDVGSGPGLWSNQLAQKVAPNGLIVGIDCSQEAISHAENELKKSPYREIVEYRQANFFNIPFPAETFDVVFCSNALMYFPDEVKTQTLQEQKRVLKVGGRMVSKEYDGETIIVFPIPPELWLKLKNAVAQVLSERAKEEYYDEYVARKVRQLFLDLGLESIVTIPYPVQMFSPLSSTQKNYITEESQWLIKTASPYLSQLEVSQLEAYFDSASAEYILDRADFSYLMVEFMSMGTKTNEK